LNNDTCLLVRIVNDFGIQKEIAKKNYLSIKKNVQTTNIQKKSATKRDKLFLQKQLKNSLCFKLLFLVFLKDTQVQSKDFQ